MQVLLSRSRLEPGPCRPLDSLPYRLAVLLLLVTWPAGTAGAAASPVAAPADSLWTGPALPSTFPSTFPGTSSAAARSLGAGPDRPQPATGPLPSATLQPTLPGRPVPVEGSWPLRPKPNVRAGFDPPASRWGAGHRGVDLAGAPAAAVRTALAGTVTFAGRIAGRGVVVVSHGRARTTHEPVAAVVTIGDQVSAGAVIGRLELSGSHCFPGWCLHWGLIEGRDHYLDPLTLVGATPVRLLPLGDAAG